MWIVKLGGSLCFKPSLASWLDQLGCYGPGQVVVVPGGGPFAEQVRTVQSRWGFSDAVAHRMAVQAMDQFGLLLTGLRPDLAVAASLDEIQEVLAIGQVPVWMAGWDPLSNEVPATWEVTSDSLAGFLARQLGARRLFLVKSVVPEGNARTAQELGEAGLVDPAFKYFLAEGKFSAWVVGEKDHCKLREMLYAGVSLGVEVISTWNGHPKVWR